MRPMVGALRAGSILDLDCLGGALLPRRPPRRPPQSTMFSPKAKKTRPAAEQAGFGFCYAEKQITSHTHEVLSRKMSSETLHLSCTPNVALGTHPQASTAYR